MAYENPQYFQNVFGDVVAINCQVNSENVSIPINDENTDYQEIMRQVNEEGLVIQPYEG